MPSATYGAGPGSASVGQNAKLDSSPSQSDALKWPIVLTRENDERITATCYGKPVTTAWVLKKRRIGQEVEPNNEGLFGTWLSINMGEDGDEDDDDDPPMPPTYHARPDGTLSCAAVADDYQPDARLKVDHRSGEVSYGGRGDGWIPLVGGGPLVASIDSFRHGYIVVDGGGRPTTRHMVAMGSGKPRPQPPDGRYVRFGEDGPRQAVEVSFNIPPDDSFLDYLPDMSRPHFAFTTFAINAIRSIKRLARTVVEQMAAPGGAAGYVYPVVEVRPGSFLNPEDRETWFFDWVLRDWLHVDARRLQSRDPQLCADLPARPEPPAPEVPQPQSAPRRTRHVRKSSRSAREPDAWTIAQALDPHANQHADSWQVRCPAHEDRRPSMSISSSPEGRTLFHCFAGCSQREVLTALKKRGLWSSRGPRRELKPRPAGPDPEEQERHQEILERWNRIYREQAVPVADHPVARRYLEGRGCLIPRQPQAALRAHDALPYGSSGKRWPGLIVPLLAPWEPCQPRDAFVSYHLTYLEPDGSGKAEIDLPRLFARGLSSYGVARLTEGDLHEPDAGPARLAIGEGIETCLSLAKLYGTERDPLHVWATLNAGNMTKLPAVRGVRELLIAVDHDKAGEKAAHTCASRWHAAGVTVRLIRPRRQGADLNDVAQGQRP